MPDISTFLWFADKAEEAVRFYVSLLPDSSVQSVTALPGPMDVSVMEFTLQGRPFTAMQAAQGAEPFNNAISMVLLCDSQAEIDRLWDALIAGGSGMACGWLMDRYGLRWQIVPRKFIAMTKDKDKAKAGRALNAMYGMVKLDAAALERAFNG